MQWGSSEPEYLQNKSNKDKNLWNDPFLQWMYFLILTEAILLEKLIII